MKMKEGEDIGNYFNDLLAITKIGSWDYNLITNEITYSTAWAELLGYHLDDLLPVPETWEKMVVPEDLNYVNEQIQKHISGETSFYEAEFRMIRKDGRIIYVQDKGKIIENNDDGTPRRFIGVLQDITTIKKTENKLRENQETLDLAINIAELGTWDWNIPKNIVQCNNEYLEMIGYSRNDFHGTIEEWTEMIHPNDRPRILQLVNDYMTGKIPKLECEMRMRCKNGDYIWTKDMGRIVERDQNGIATRIVGGRLNISVVKKSKKCINETLGELKHHKDSLEKEIINRTKTLTEQDEMLWTINHISQKLFSVNHLDNIDNVINSSLEAYCTACGKDRIALWKNKIINNIPHCTSLYEYSFLQDKVSFGVEFEKLIDPKNLEKLIENMDINMSAEELSSLLSSARNKYIPYPQYLPSIHSSFEAGKTLNSLTSSLSDFERFQMALRNVKAFMVTPIILNDKIWGFIGVDNCKTEELFSEVEEKMLSILGFFLATSIEKNKSEKQIREAEERVQLMINATPLCCNLWAPDFQNMTCNEEAVRLFDLSSRQEYLDRFFDLSPEYQPCGRLSSEMSLENITKAFEEGFCKFEWIHQKLDGTPIPSEITLVRVKYKDDFIVAGYTRDLREYKAMLASLQAKEDDLRAAMEEALLSSKAKTNFLANMSHEIRTPMNAISGFTEILMRESKDNASIEYAKNIKNACNSLLNIINDILDISKIESGKLEIINSPYELSSLLNDAIAISRMRIGNKPLMFITNIDSKLPANLIGDEIRIKQILINLLSNAIKFTDTGHISLSVSSEIMGGKAKLRFDIADTGFGIKSEDINRLFEEFERINTTKNRSIEGTGLGLAICKQLCEMMNGDIEVKSTFGKGSLFTVTIVQDCPAYLPLATVTKPKTVLVYESREVYLNSIKETVENLGCKCIPCIGQSQFNDNINLMHYDFVITSTMHLIKVKSILTTNKLNSSLIVFTDYGENLDDNSICTLFSPINCLQLSNLFNGEKDHNKLNIENQLMLNFIAPSARVLLVDDNEVNLTVATGLMLPYELSIDTAENGRKAVEMVEKNTYDLVFMDHMMPEMDGIDATIAIRNLEGDYYKSLPIIALTANALVGTKEMFLNEGMNDFLAKPIEIGKLAHILAKWLPSTKKISVDQVDVKKESLVTPDFEIPDVNVAKGILSIGGNKNNYMHILSVYYNDGLKKQISLLEHFNSKDILAFRTEIHALKSTSATIGATELSIAAGKLEIAALNADIAYIEKNIHPFLVNLKHIIHSIAPHVVNDSEYREKERSTLDLALGSSLLLKESLEKLLYATEIANINQIEEILLLLDNFRWTEEIQNTLLAIKESLAMFDYDSVVDCIISLQNKI